MAAKLLSLCLLILLSSNRGILAVAEENISSYNSPSNICEKCNCTSPTENAENSDSVFTVDCSMRNLSYIFSEWPEYFDDKFKEIIYIMSFNSISTLPAFPSTEKAIFFTCKNCKISAISENAFIDTINIISLDLSHNELSSSSLNPDIFRGPHSNNEYSPINMQMLDMRNNKINFLDERLFEHVPYLKKLDLSFNKLENLEDGTLKALASCQNLEILFLEHTSISSLPVELFENMKHLSEIDLSDNNFKEVPASLSSVASTLKMLILNSNPIEVVNSESFSNLEKLEKLSLNNMPELKSIEKQSFEDLKSLEILECRGNKKLISMNLQDLPQLNLIVFDISKNNLKTLDFGDVVEVEIPGDKENFKKLHTLKLSGNPWNCDCKMIKALDFFNHNATYFIKAEKFDEARCASPFDLSSKLLYILPLDYVCAADHKSKPMKIPVYEPPQFLRPKSIMLTIGSVVIVIVLGIIIGILIVCISRRLKANHREDSNPIRYSTVRNSTMPSN